MITVQNVPQTGCNVFYGNYFDNYNGNVRSRYYIYDGQAVQSSSTTYTYNTRPDGSICWNPATTIYNPLLQTALIFLIVAGVIAVFYGTYATVIKPFIKTKKGGE